MSGAWCGDVGGLRQHHARLFSRGEKVWACLRQWGADLVAAYISHCPPWHTGEILQRCGWPIGQSTLKLTTNSNFQKEPWTVLSPIRMALKTGPSLSVLCYKSPLWQYGFWIVEVCSNQSIIVWASSSAQDYYLNCVLPCSGVTHDCNTVTMPHRCYTWLQSNKKMITVLQWHDYSITVF